MSIPACFRAECEFCGKDVDIRVEGVHQWTSGWVKVRDAGGGHGVSLPKREDRWAHKSCVIGRGALRLV
jgi:hypothetical protein